MLFVVGCLFRCLLFVVWLAIECCLLFVVCCVLACVVVFWCVV